MMRGYLKLFLLWVVIFSAGWAKTYFVFETSKYKGELEKKIDKIEGDILLSQKLIKIVDSFGGLELKVDKTSDGSTFILRTKTLPSSELTAILYQRLKSLYPDLYFVESGSSPKVIKQKEIVNVGGQVESDKDFTIWIALFGLGIIGVLALSLSSFQVKDLMKKHKLIEKKHEEMERKISEMFSMMGENIHKLSKDIVQYTSDIIEETDSKPIKTKLEKVVSAENRVLDSATNLLDFLYLKAKKVEVKKEHFNINDALNDMLENLVKNVTREEIELIFDVDKSMPKFIIGDFIHIGDVFGKLLEHIVVVSSSPQVKVAFSSNTLYSGGLELHSTFNYTSDIDLESSDSYFIPVYDEARGEYERLGLYVAGELVKLMGGEITVEFNRKSSSYTISVTIPVEESPDEERRKYHLPSKDYIQRNILIVNMDYEASLALKRLFSYFKHKIRTITAEKLESEKIDFSNYDILMIDEKLITRPFVEQISDVKSQKEIKLVALKSIFNKKYRNRFGNKIDFIAKKPMTQQNALSLLEDLYTQGAKIVFDYEEHHEERPPQQHKPKITAEKKGTISTVITSPNREPETPAYESDDRPLELEVEDTNGAGEESSRQFQSNIVPTPNVGVNSFKEFSKYTILVVEDNFINMKMLLRVLDASHMKIYTAQNGLEAVNKVKDLGAENLDLVLMDINMPVMDGYTATKRIRELDNGKELPIVALSALSLENEFRRMQEAEMDAYIPKPLDIGKLYTVFSIYLSKNYDESKTPVKEDDEVLEIEGIDVDSALEHVNNNVILLREVLYEFISIYGESDKEIEKLYSERRFEQLRQYLFDLVGLTNTIGAKDLAHYAKEMRKLYIYDKLDILPSYLKDYSKALMVIKESLNNYLKR